MGKWKSIQDYEPPTDKPLVCRYGYEEKDAIYRRTWRYGIFFDMAGEVLPVPHRWKIKQQQPQGVKE